MRDCCTIDLLVPWKALIKDPQLFQNAWVCKSCGTLYRRDKGLIVKVTLLPPRCEWTPGRQPERKRVMQVTCWKCEEQVDMLVYTDSGFFRCPNCEEEFDCDEVRLRRDEMNYLLRTLNAIKGTVKEETVKTSG